MRHHANSDRCQHPWCRAEYPRHPIFLGNRDAKSTAGSWVAADQLTGCHLRCHHSNGAGSRASIERIVGSGSEPTYLPLTNTSFAGLVLYFLGAANALDAVAITRATASAVLVNMMVSPAGWSITLHPVCA